MLTPATITVNFTANYAGPHRICWRQCAVGAFVCTNIVDCVGGGNVCSATVSIMVDPESCTPVCFEGYIQATCNPEGSPVDQVPWSATFTPTPSCNLYFLQCETQDPMGCGVIPAAVTDVQKASIIAAILNKGFVVDCRPEGTIISGILKYKQYIVAIQDGCLCYTPCVIP